MCIYSVKAVKMCIDEAIRCLGTADWREVILYQSEKQTDILREAVRLLKAQFVSIEVCIQELELLTDIIPFFMGYNSVRKQMS